MDKLKRKPHITRVIVALCCLLTALAIELCYRWVMPYVNEVQGGERKLIWLSHTAALISLALAIYRPKLPKILNRLMLAVSPAVAFMLMEYITHFAVRDISPAVMGLNMLLFYLFFLALMFLTGSTGAAQALTTLLPAAVGLISLAVIQFRGMPLLPWDISSFTTAMGVVSNYSFMPDIRCFFVFSLALFMALLGIKGNERVLPGRLGRRLICGLCSLAMLALACLYIPSDNCRRLFSLTDSGSDIAGMYTDNGFFVAFLMCADYDQKPENYSLAMVEDIAASYPSDAVEDREERPNVIVIMNESFSDLSVLGDFQTSEPLFPFISSLEENTAKGWAHVSVLGGNTPNSEFEFLTGLTMGFLPQGSVAYNQYITAPLPTLADQFEALGYRTIGTHAFWGGSWNRDVIYPLLGFGESIFLDSYPQELEKLRLWVTDSAMYDVVEDMYEESQDPLFLFGISMMNHGGYHGNLDDFDSLVTVDGLEDNGSVTEYITLMRETDRDFQELIEYFSHVDEKTVILFFGDHQPNDDVASPILELIGRDLDPQDPAQKSQRYITPYILWANYDVDWDLPEDLSLNYLGAVLMEACSLELTGAQKYLLDLMEDYPVISSQCYWESDGSIRSISGYTGDERLLEYASLQYNDLIDKTRRIDQFWTLAG